MRIVTQWSATRGCEAAQPVAADHIGIIKPPSDADDSYIALKNAAAEAIARTSQAVKTVPPAGDVKSTSTWRDRTPSDAFNFELIEVVQGAKYTTLQGINDSGEIIGAYAVELDLRMRWFLRLPDGKLLLDMRPPQSTHIDDTTLSGLNNKGEIVGTITDVSSKSPLGSFTGVFSGDGTRVSSYSTVSTVRIQVLRQSTITDRSLAMRSIGPEDRKLFCASTTERVG